MVRGAGGGGGGSLIAEPVRVTSLLAFRRRGVMEKTPEEQARPRFFSISRALACCAIRSSCGPIRVRTAARAGSTSILTDLGSSPCRLGLGWRSMTRPALPFVGVSQPGSSISSVSPAARFENHARRVRTPGTGAVTSGSGNGAGVGAAAASTAAGAGTGMSAAGRGEGAAGNVGLGG